MTRNTLSQHVAPKLLLPALVLASLFATPSIQARTATQPAAASHGYTPLHVRVPPLAVDDKSIVLVWNKPDDYSNIVDYKVYMNGKLLGTASENARQYSVAQPYIDNFYKNDTQNIHVKITNHDFTVTGLQPSTTYRFTVRSVFGDGHLSAPSKILAQKTTASPAVCDVTAHGAVGDGKTINTKAIQETINTCPDGGKILIAGGVFKSGALFFKSNMTFEVAGGATLLGSEHAEDYPLARGYTLYEYSSVNRPPSLINALDPNRRAAGTFENIRIVGKGVIDGNGWNRQSTPTIADEAGFTLPQYISGSKDRFGDGILAKSQMDLALKDGLSAGEAYGQRRSSLMTLRGVKNLYIADLTILNPA
ncbi:MAG TPA: fibronectin type III domain-containing protein, partial [Rhodocyclaceae bacterium]|nr:fibronectin type III domain-containing protein [Rhodocyclaceae bacterium]